MPVNPKLSLQALGFTPASPQNQAASTALSAAATWLAYSFSLPSALTINKFRTFASAVGGTLAGTDLSCDIYSDVNGVPGVSLATTATVTATPTGAAWVEWTGFTFAATAGTQYWIVLKNVNGVPATNFPTFLHGSSGTGSTAFFGSLNPLWGRNKSSTANSGGAWTTNRFGTCGWRLDFSDGSFLGEPIQGIAQPANTAGVYLTREAGVTFMAPNNAVVNVRGLALALGKTGTPPGLAQFRLYNGTTLLATTLSIPAGNCPVSPTWIMLPFSAAVPLFPGTLVRVSISTTTGGDTSNFYTGLEYTLNNDANSKALFPFGTSANPTNVMKKTYFDGSTWTDTDTVLMPAALVLESDGEFGSLGRGLVVPT